MPQKADESTDYLSLYDGNKREWGAGKKNLKYLQTSHVHAPNRRGDGLARQKTIASGMRRYKQKRDGGKAGEKGSARSHGTVSGGGGREKGEDVGEGGHGKDSN